MRDRGVLLAGLLAAIAAPAAAAPSAQTLARLCPAGVDAPPRIPLADLRRMFGAPGDKYMTIDGIELRYRDEGKGPVLLLLHGSRSTLNQWDRVVARLKDRYRLVRFDQPPLGLSGPLSKEAMAAVGSPEALMTKFLDRLHIGKVTPVGVSSGGTMAYYFAAAHPERTDAVVLSNTPADSVAEAKLESTPALDAAVARNKRLGVEDRDFWFNYLTFLYGDLKRMPADLIDRYCVLNLRQAEPNMVGLQALTANKPRTAEALKGVRAPVLILWGMRDKVLKPAAATALQSYLINARSISFVALDSVGHYPPMESPEAIADLIDTYLKRDR